MTTFSPTAAPAPAESTASLHNLPRRQLYGAVVGLMLALFLAALDQTIVGTAMPRIVADLNGFSHYAWVTTAYLVASTAVVPIVGKLSDLYGRKPFFLIGVGIFLVASVLCGLAGSMLQLVASRGLQGLGAGLITAMVFTVVADLFPPARRGRVQGIFGSVFGLASIIGPLLGGYITDHLSWRWVFLVNLPVGLVALLALITLFPHVRPAGRRHQIDYAGAATLIVAVVALLLALSWGGRERTWDSPEVLGLLTLGLGAVALFLWVESRAAEPIIPLDLFRSSIVSIGVLAATLTAIGMFGTLLFVPLYIQGIIGASATASGSALMPMMLAMVGASTGSGQFIARTGRYRLAALAGLGVMVLGMLLLAAMPPSVSYGEVVRNMILVGLGLGATMPIFTLVVQNAVPYERLGVATAVTQFARSIGGTLGAALFGSLLVARYEPAFHAALEPSAAASLSPAQLATLSDPQTLLDPHGAEALRESFAALGPRGADLLAAVLEAIRLGLAGALHDVFLVGAAVVAVGWVAAFFLQEIPLRRSHGPPVTVPGRPPGTPPEQPARLPALEATGQADGRA